MTVTYLRNSILPRAYEWDERALLSHITKLVLKRVDNTCVQAWQFKTKPLVLKLPETLLLYEYTHC